MSDRLPRFSIAPSRAAVDQEISSEAFRVLAVLGMFADKEGWCWPSQRTIGDLLGISRQGVSYHIQRLKELGYLNVSERVDEMGQHSNMYQVRYDFDPASAGLAGGASLGLAGGASLGLAQNVPMNAPSDIGAVAPETPVPPLDWQIAGGVRKLHLPEPEDLKRAEYSFLAGQYCRGHVDLEPYFVAVQEGIRRAVQKAEVGVWRKELQVCMYEGYTPEQVRLACEQHCAKKSRAGEVMVFRSPGSVMYLLRAGLVQPEPVVEYVPVEGLR